MASTGSQAITVSATTGTGARDRDLLLALVAVEGYEVRMGDLLG